MTRRELIKRSALCAALLDTGFVQAFPFDKKSFLKIGACDWSIGKSADVTALALADQIGLDGIQQYGGRNNCSIERLCGSAISRRRTSSNGRANVAHAVHV